MSVGAEKPQSNVWEKILIATGVSAVSGFLVLAVGGIVANLAGFIDCVESGKTGVRVRGGQIVERNIPQDTITYQLFQTLYSFARPDKPVSAAVKLSNYSRDPKSPSYRCPLEARMSLKYNIDPEKGSIDKWYESLGSRDGRGMIGVFAQRSFNEVAAKADLCGTHAMPDKDKFESDLVNNINGRLKAENFPAQVEGNLYFLSASFSM